MNLIKYINKVPNFPKKNVLFYDLSPLIASATAWQYTVNKICDIAKQFELDLVAGIESRGFLLSAAVATKLKLGSVLIRKKGKTPGNVVSCTYKLEYGEDTLEINADSLKANNRILILDDVLATGGTLNAACELIKKAHCCPIAAICILELLSLKDKGVLNVPVYSLLKI